MTTNRPRPTSPARADGTADGSTTSAPGRRLGSTPGRRLGRLALLGVVVLLAGTPAGCSDGEPVDAVPPPTGSPAVTGSTGATPAATVTTAVTTDPAVARFGVRVIAALQARAALHKAGIAVPRQARLGGAWQWRDANGLNLLYLGRMGPGDGSGVDTLVAVLAASPDGRLVELRRMTEASRGGCDVDYVHDFTRGSVQVTDRDINGVAEVTVGWFSRCAGDNGPGTAKLALLSGGNKYILRGRGTLEVHGEEVPAATFTPTPAEGSWPRDGYESTVALFRRLYF